MLELQIKDFLLPIFRGPIKMRINRVSPKTAALFYFILANSSKKIRALPLKAVKAKREI